MAAELWGTLYLISVGNEAEALSFGELSDGVPIIRDSAYFIKIDADFHSGNGLSLYGLSS